MDDRMRKWKDWWKEARWAIGRDLSCIGQSTLESPREDRRAVCRCVWYPKTGLPNSTHAGPALYQCDVEQDGHLRGVCCDLALLLSVWHATCVCGSEAGMWAWHHLGALHHTSWISLSRDGLSSAGDPSTLGAPMATAIDILCFY